MLKVTGKGITCKEVELIFTMGGTGVATVTVVNNEEYQGRESVCFTKLKLFGDIAEDFANEVGKGCLIEIEGYLYDNVWETDDGQKRYDKYVKVTSYELLRDFEKEKAEGNGKGKGKENSNKGKGQDKGKGKGNSNNRRSPSNRR